MYTNRTPLVLKALYRDLLWNRSRAERKVFLTFDDGPVPEATPFVLDTLAAYQAKATFFCIGSNVEANPAIYRRILEEGHGVGNHTYNHLNGWKVSNDEYLKDIALCEKHVQSNLFRPPYGRILRNQAKALLPHKKIVMWDVLSADFDTRIAPEQCLRNVVEHTQNGSIIVFHDSVKAFERMSYALPRFLEHLSEAGFETASL